MIIVTMPSTELSKARLDYIKKKNAHEDAEAKLCASIVESADRQDDLAYNEHYSQEDADAAFGYLSRIAKKEGFRALLSGELNKEDSR